MQNPRSLTDGSISRGLVRLALPILCANVLQAINGSVNAVWVGHYLGESALTALSNTHVVMQLLGGAALGIAMAATILIGQCIGANNLIEAKRVIGTSLIFFATISVAISVAGLVFAEPLLILMMTPPDSLPLAIAYMKMMALSVPSMYLYMFVVSVLNGAGNSKTMFYSTLLSVAIGVVLNPVFIDGLGSIPRLGIAGSGASRIRATALYGSGIALATEPRCRVSAWR